jgi:colicin import membrane protein
MSIPFPHLRLKRTSPLQRRGEPGKFPAAILAILVHAGFFGVIVFGLSWQVQRPTQIAAELWESLPPLKNVSEAPVPEPAPAPPPAPAPEPVVKKVAEPPKPSQADIQLKAKREKEELARKQREEAKQEELRKKAEADKKRKEEDARRKAEDAKRRALEAKMQAEQEAREATARAVRNAAINDYGARIGKLIKDRANIPDTVTGRPEIQVRLRLLVNGVVFDAQIVKPSGNRVYDEAVERAINGIRQWPLPDNPDILGGRRELNLNITHER